VIAISSGISESFVMDHTGTWINMRRVSEFKIIEFGLKIKEFVIIAVIDGGHEVWLTGPYNDYEDADSDLNDAMGWDG